MQLSYNVIKQTNINDKILVSPPTLEKMFLNITRNNNEIKIEEVVEQIKQQAKNEAQKIIDEANKKANEIINQAKENAEKIYQDANSKGYNEGYNRGYSDGYQSGIDAATIDSKNIIDEANNYLYTIQKESEEYISNFQNDIIRLALEIAKEIVKCELTINNEAVLTCAQKLLSKSKNKKSIILKTSIGDYKVLKSRQHDLEQCIESNATLTILADSSLDSGDFILETSSGVIDAKLETQIKILAQKLLKE